MLANSDVSDSHRGGLANHLIAVSRSLHCNWTVYSIQRVVMMAGRVMSHVNLGACSSAPRERTEQLLVAQHWRPPADHLLSRTRHFPDRYHYTQT